jgi:predicted metalloprotease with PDZ domain
MAAIAVALLSLALQPRALSAQPAEVVRHELSFPDRHNQYVQVRSVWPAGSDALELAMASWTPGSYLIRDFAAHVEELVATGPDGLELRVTKSAKNRWRIEGSEVGETTVSYRVWAGEMNVATSWVESGMALINGAGIFLYSEATRDWAQELHVQLPEDWSGLHTSLRPAEGTARFRARDFDELVDSPVLAGNTVEYEFEVSDQPYSLVLGSENPLWDGERSRDDVAQLVAAQQDFWGTNPFDRRYLFLNLFIGPVGGLEHDHSTVMMTSPWQMRATEDYIKWLGLVSHEFFHSWNVRRMRPRELVRYDYDGETYTRSLWLAEGLSSYYDNLLVFRAGLIDVSHYFELLAEEIRIFETTPGRRVRSAERASFDTWIKHYKPDENSINSTVSYYRKGAIIGFVSDMAIRRATDNGTSLDNVMRTMYRRYGPDAELPGGYPRGAFEDVVGELAGAEVKEQVSAMIRGTADPAVDEALAWYGLSLDRRNGGQSSTGLASSPGPGLGVSLAVDGGRLIVEQVPLGHAGAEAGLLPGDELIALGGMRVTPGDYADRVQRLREGDEIELTIARHERLMRLPLTVQAQIPDSYVILSEADIGRREKRRLQAWLGRDLRFGR